MADKQTEIRDEELEDIAAGMQQVPSFREYFSDYLERLGISESDPGYEQAFRNGFSEWRGKTKAILDANVQEIRNNRA